MNVYESVTNRIMAQLEQGLIPWRKEWKLSGSTGLPFNHQTGKQYRGINILLLLSSGFADARWITYKQAQELGGNVRRGEHGTKIVFWSLFDRTRKGESEQPENGSESEAERVPFMKEYTVFNAEQIEGLPLSLPFDGPAFEPIPAAQAACGDYLTREHLELRHGGDRAFYSPSLDYVQMPKREAFVTPDSYYSTLFHELGHSTGHRSRLDRGAFKKEDTFGPEGYSREELVAEFTAAFLCAETGISNAMVEANHTAYIQSWLKSLKNDPKMAVLAAQRAQKAADRILDRKLAEQASEAVAA